MRGAFNDSILAQYYAKTASYECQEGDVVFSGDEQNSSLNNHLHCHDIRQAAQMGIMVPTVANATGHTPVEYAVPLYGYCMPLLLVVTVIANTMIVAVMSRKHMRTPTNMVLMAMAVADTLTLLVPSPWMLYLYTLNQFRRPFTSITSCYFYYAMMNTLPALLHTSSIWLTLVLATQRYVYVCHPHIARTWCTGPRVKRTICWIVVAAALHQLPRMFDRRLDMVGVIVEGHETSSCTVAVAGWVRQWIGVDVYFGAYYIFRLLFVHLLPCVSLVALNILLFLTLKRTQKKREQLLNMNKARRKENRRGADAQCTTLMLIVVVSAFLIVEIPLAVVTCIHIAQNLMDNVVIVDYSVIQALVVVINFIITLSYPINFAIYCGMSRQFRETFAHLFLQRNRSTTAEVRQYNDACTAFPARTIQETHL